eukprot:113183-Pelagomonas_calceolata.AAC.3
MVGGCAGHQRELWPPPAELCVCAAPKPPQSHAHRDSWEHIRAGTVALRKPAAPPVLLQLPALPIVHPQVRQLGSWVIQVADKRSTILPVTMLALGDAQDCLEEGVAMAQFCNACSHLYDDPEGSEDASMSISRASATPVYRSVPAFEVREHAIS